MGRAVILILIAVGALVAFGVVVVGVFAVLRALPEHVRTLIKDFQALVGGLIALTVAVIAFSGVLFSVSAQSENTRKQMEAASLQFKQDVDQRRDAERRATDSERRQLAAAFASEITVIAQVFSGSELLQRNDKSIVSIEHSIAMHAIEPMSVAFNKPHSDYAVIYRANAGRIGLFSPGVAEEIVRFYGTYIQLDENLKVLDQAAKEHFEHMSPRDVENALRGQNIDLRGLQAIKSDLVPRLQSFSAETSSLIRNRGVDGAKPGRSIQPHVHSSVPSS